MEKTTRSLHDQGLTPAENLKRLFDMEKCIDRHVTNIHQDAVNLTQEGHDRLTYTPPKSVIKGVGKRLVREGFEVKKDLQKSGTLMIKWKLV